PERQEHGRLVEHPKTSGRGVADQFLNVDRFMHVSGLVPSGMCLRSEQATAEPFSVPTHTEYRQSRNDGDRRFGSIMLTSPRSTLMSVGSTSMRVRRRNTPSAAESSLKPGSALSGSRRVRNLSL